MFFFMGVCVGVCLAEIDDDATIDRDGSGVGSPFDCLSASELRARRQSTS